MRAFIASRHFMLSLSVLLSLSCLAFSGCARSMYRQQADREVEAVIAEKHGWIENGTITPGPESRLYDPASPDHPALPCDDPESHALMHCIDGKRGFAGWHRNGDSFQVDAGTWQQYLQRDENGQVVLKREDAIQAALVNSRDYQSELEDLYLSALDVTFERFRFDTQFFAGNSTEFREDGRSRPGGSAHSRLSTTTDAQMRKLTATGGEIVFGLANAIVWEFSGSGTNSIDSVLDFSLVQPLLRFGGRERVLERLTQSERTLLANVRQMEQFRQGFYVDIITGRNSGSGPSRGGNVGQAGLGVIAGSPSGRTGAASAGGYLGLLQEQQRIHNQEMNIVALRDSLAQLESAFDFGRINSRLQVDQARQALYNGQSDLLAAQASYKSRLDAYKIDLGLPPSFDLEVRDSMLDHFNLIAPELRELQDEATSILLEIRALDLSDAAQQKAPVARMISLQQRVQQQLDVVAADFAELEANLPQRIVRLKQVREQVRRQNADVDPQVYDVDLLKERIAKLQKRFPSIRDRFAVFWVHCEQFDTAPIPADVGELKKYLRGLVTELSGLLLELSLYQAETRLDTMKLVPVQLQPEVALEVAREQRLDWMNARANLVDSWRQIEFDANALQSDLDLVISGDIRTKGDNPVKFRGDTGQLRFGLNVDTPTTRVAERNRYRETLIEYQRSRRDYMLFEDRVDQSIRNTLRIAELGQLNFEVRRAAVQVAIAQVDIARFRLNEPLRPRETNKFSPTTARDLVSALTDLLDAQNDLLDVWVNYEVLRVVLDFELGTMKLNDNGVWIDPGPIQPSSFATEDAAEELPPPVPEE
ncbi:MAG: hypothetical protein ACI9HK_004648 [Pirellulaceae bacterium]